MAKDTCRLDTLNDTGFRKLVHEFAPRYTPPNKETIATNTFPRMFESEKKRIEKSSIQQHTTLLPQTCGRQGLSMHILVLQFTTSVKNSPCKATLQTATQLLISLRS